MDIASFEYLVSLLRESLTRDAYMGNKRTPAGIVIPELRLDCVICYLANRQYPCIICRIGIHRSTFYDIVWSTIDAMNKCQELALPGLPSTPQQLITAAAEFAALSEDSVIDQCVSVGDGYLAEAQTPSRRFAGNVRSFFSGHYMHYGLNVQAFGDSIGRFQTFADAGTGSMDDQTAFEATGAYMQVEKLPLGYYVICDAAYVASDCLLTIFHGANCENVANDNWN